MCASLKSDSRQEFAHSLSLFELEPTAPEVRRISSAFAAGESTTPSTLKSAQRKSTRPTRREFLRLSNGDEHEAELWYSRDESFRFMGLPDLIITASTRREQITRQPACQPSRAQQPSSTDRSIQIIETTWKPRISSV
ncbi:unnamed protein product [Protopolystoma xenopodis]|uniref:Uncharacterized protein n=1 Tax=Protopolystoma xenopodis TaxID=117903 RepID=A0A448XS88_9PLAT|nr:unnamed protein product [Protopolystoma xenopodis]